MLTYFITDPKYPLKKIFNSIKQYKPNFVCYRNKQYYDESEIIKFAKFAKKYSKILINYDDLKNEKLLAYFDGIHFPSSKINFAINYSEKLKIVSTHNIEEVKKAKELNFDYITFSPIFASKNRPGLGIKKLNEICQIFPNTIALGGIISKKEIKEIQNSKAVGFGSIRYFIN